MPRKLTVIGVLMALTFGALGVFHSSASAVPIQTFLKADVDYDTCFGGAAPTGGSLTCGAGSSDSVIPANFVGTSYNIIRLPQGSRLTLPITFTPYGPGGWQTNTAVTCTAAGPALANNNCSDNTVGEPTTRSGLVAGDVQADTDLLCNSNQGAPDVLATGASTPGTGLNGKWPSTSGPVDPTWVPFNFKRTFAGTAGSQSVLTGTAAGAGIPIPLTGAPNPDKDAYIDTIKPQPSSSKFVSLSGGTLTNLWLFGTAFFPLPDPTPLQIAEYESGYAGQAGLVSQVALLGGDPSVPPTNSYICLDSPQSSVSRSTTLKGPAANGMYPRWTIFTSAADFRDGTVNRILDETCVTVGPPLTDNDNDCLPVGVGPHTESAANDAVGMSDIDGDGVPDGVESWSGTASALPCGPVGPLPAGLGFGANATGSTATTMTDTSQSWAVNAYAGKVVTMGGSTATVASNTNNKLTFSAWSPLGPVTGPYFITGAVPPGAVAPPAQGTTSADCDGDGATDFEEMFQFTDPSNPDTDGDGSLDHLDSGKDEDNASPSVFLDSNYDDNCPADFNPTQANSDSLKQYIILPAAKAGFNDTTNPHADLLGDACDTDNDNDGIPNVAEPLMLILNVGAPTFCKGPGTAGTHIPAVTMDPLIADSDLDLGLDGRECQQGSRPDLATTAGSGRLPNGTASSDPDGDSLFNSPSGGLSPAESFYHTQGINVAVPFATNDVNDGIVDGQDNNPDGDLLCGWSGALTNVATSSNATTLTDSTAPFPSLVNALNGRVVSMGGSFATITASSTTQLTFSGGWSPLGPVTGAYGVSPAPCTGPATAVQNGDRDADSDNDGIKDGVEVRFYGTDPANYDTDGDGCGDGTEAADIDGNRSADAIDLQNTSAVIASAPYFGSIRDAVTGKVDQQYVSYDFNRNGNLDAIDLSLMSSPLIAGAPCGVQQGHLPLAGANGTKLSLEP